MIFNDPIKKQSWHHEKVGFRNGFTMYIHGFITVEVTNFQRRFYGNSPRNWDYWSHGSGDLQSRLNEAPLNKD
jgi:hypothetical protein